MTTIEFIPQELLDKLFLIGYTVDENDSMQFDKRGEPRATLEQSERWIWEKHFIFIEITIVPDCEEPYTTHLFKGTTYESALLNKDGMIKTFPDPFSARLAGVEAVVKYLIKQKGEK